MAFGPSGSIHLQIINSGIPDVFHRSLRREGETINLLSYFIYNTHDKATTSWMCHNYDVFDPLPLMDAPCQMDGSLASTWIFPVVSWGVLSLIFSYNKLKIIAVLGLDLHLFIYFYFNWSLWLWVMRIGQSSSRPSGDAYSL